MVSRWSRVIGVATALIFLTLAIAPLASTADVATATVAPAESAGWYEAEGSGFDSQELVALSVSGPSGQTMLLAEHTTTPSGNFNYLFRMPRHAEEGAWTMILLGKDSERTASATFELPLLGADIELLTSPKSAPIGTEFSFVASAFKGRETVKYWLTGPDSKIYLNGALDASPTGRVFFGARVNDPMPFGLWKMSAYGIISDHLGIAEFKVGPIGTPVEGVLPLVPSVTPTLTITPGDTPATYRVQAGGFGHTEYLTAAVTGPRGQGLGLPGRTSTSDGAIEMLFRMPRYAEAGQWTLTLEGKTTDRIVEATFEMPVLGPDLTLRTTDEVASAGMTVSISGEGFESRETVTYWLVGPDGRDYFVGDLTAKVTGHMTFKVVISESMATGLWKAYAYGKSSDHLGVVTITVT